MKLEINTHHHEGDGGGWLQATVEDFDGNILGNVTAPIVEGATFDIRGAVIRAAVEEAIVKLNPENKGPIGTEVSS